MIIDIFVVVALPSYVNTVAVTGNDDDDNDDDDFSVDEPVAGLVCSVVGPAVPVAGSVVAPVVSSVAGPVVNSVVGLVSGPVAGPVVGPVIGPVVGPIVGLVVVLFAVGSVTLDVSNEFSIDESVVTVAEVVSTGVVVVVFTDVSLVGMVISENGSLDSTAV